MKKLISYFIAVTLLLISCDRTECTNTNPVFDANLPESNEYKTELAAQLGKHPHDLTYWFDRYEEKEGEKSMSVFVQGDNLCAKAVIALHDPNNKLDGIIRAKGVGYHGAELDGLEFATTKENGETIFIYRNLDRIID